MKTGNQLLIPSPESSLLRADEVIRGFATGEVLSALHSVGLLLQIPRSAALQGPVCGYNLDGSFWHFCRGRLLNPNDVRALNYCVDNEVGPKPPY